MFSDLEVLEKKEYSKSVVPGNIPLVQDECAHEFNVKTRSNGQKKYDDYKNGLVVIHIYQINGDI